MNDSEEGTEVIQTAFKILVVGEMGTGKTSLIRQYVNNEFSEYYRTTIGVDFASKKLQWDPHTIISANLWDVAGQERFSSMTGVYFREAIAALVVFDLTRLNTLEMSKAWKKDIDMKVFTADDKPIPCILVGNKCDLVKDGWDKTDEEMKQFCDEFGFIGFFKTSALSGENLDEAFNFLIKYIIDNNIEPENTRELHQGVDVKGNGAGSKCC